MKLTYQMELNVSGEKDLRRWQKLEQRGHAASQRELMGWWETGTKLAAELLEQLSARKRQASHGAAVPIEPLPFAPADPFRSYGAPVPPEIDPLAFRDTRGGALDPMFENAGRTPRRHRSSLAELLKQKPRFAEGDDELERSTGLSARVKEAGEAMKRFGERFRRVEKAVKAAGLLDRQDEEADHLDPMAGTGDSGLDAANGGAET